jgi:hypothetical protein
MRSAWIVLLLPFITGCPGNDAPPPPPADTAAERVTADEAQGFVFLRGADTVAVERFTRGDGQLQGELLDRDDGGRATYQATVQADGRITRLELAGFGAAATAPEQRIVLEIRNDTVYGVLHEGGEREREAEPVPPGTSLHFGLSVAMLEQLIQRARAATGERAQLPVLSVPPRGDVELIHPTITMISSDSVQVEVDAQNRLRMAVDREGRILGGVNPPQNVRVERIR